MAALPNYPQLIGDISSRLTALYSDQPQLMRGFDQLHKASMTAGAIDAKTKELIAMAIAVADHCDGCMGFHAKALVQQGASRQELLEALGVAVCMGGGPSLMYAANAIAAYDAFATAR